MDEASSLTLQSKVSLILFVAQWPGNLVLFGVGVWWRQKFGRGLGFVGKLDRNGRGESATASP